MADEEKNETSKCSVSGCSHIDRPTGAETDKCNEHYQQELAAQAKKDVRAGKVGGFKNEPDKRKRASRKKKAVEEPKVESETPSGY